MSWFNLLKTPTDSIEEWRKDRQNYMLKDKVWREAGGNRTKNAMREDPTSIESIEPSKEGFDRIGKEGQIELAKQFLIRQKDAVFPFENDGILYENLQQWSRNKKVRAAIRLIGRPSIGLKLMGHKGQGRWE